MSDAHSIGNMLHQSGSFRNKIPLRYSTQGPLTKGLFTEDWAKLREQSMDTKAPRSQNSVKATNNGTEARRTTGRRM